MDTTLAADVGDDEAASSVCAAADCTNPLPPYGGIGRPVKYCSTRCSDRQRTRRARKRENDPERARESQIRDLERQADYLEGKWNPAEHAPGCDHRGAVPTCCNVPPNDPTPADLERAAGFRKKAAFLRDRKMLIPCRWCGKPIDFEPGETGRNSMSCRACEAEHPASEVRSSVRRCLGCDVELPDPAEGAIRKCEECRTKWIVV